MLGFEVRYNNEMIQSSVDGGLLEIIFTSGSLHDDEHLFIWGRNRRWMNIDFERCKISEEQFQTEKTMIYIESKLK